MAKKFFIIAGEASGDLLGSKLIRELKLQLNAKNETAEFIGIGGPLMEEEGLISIFPMSELSIMGFFEILPHLAKLLRRIKQTSETILKENPDFVITIDSPDFCFRVMKKLSKSEERWKRIHLIAPSVWAYRPGRAKKISKLYDLLLAVLPFEPPYFEKHGLRTVFIGHPLIAESPNFDDKKTLAAEFRKQHGISEEAFMLCVTAGSRNSEVKKIFPEFIEAINLLSQKIPNLKIILPLVDKTRELILSMSKTLRVEYFPITKKEKKSAFFAADFALAKSGTNTLEFSLYRLPMIIAYKVNFLSFLLLKLMVKVRFANLVNLILNREVIPEMIQQNCRGKKIAVLLEKLIKDQNFAQKQIIESEMALKLMGLKSLENPSRKAAEEIINL